MRAPLSWLRDHVRVDATPQQIARRLNVSTMEVERVIETGVPDVAGNLGHFVVGRVLDLEIGHEGGPLVFFRGGFGRYTS